MNIWWHNGGLRLDPETREEMEALTLLWRASEKSEPAEQRVVNGEGSTSVGLEHSLNGGIAGEQVSPSLNLPAL